MFFQAGADFPYPAPSMVGLSKRLHVLSHQIPTMIL